MLLLFVILALLVFGAGFVLKAVAVGVILALILLGAGFITGRNQNL